jgi:hypothetical protein
MESFTCLFPNRGTRDLDKVLSQVGALLERRNGWTQQGGSAARAATMAAMNDAWRLLDARMRVNGCSVVFAEKGAALLNQMSAVMGHKEPVEPNDARLGTIRSLVLDVILEIKKPSA